MYSRLVFFSYHPWNLKAENLENEYFTKQKTKNVNSIKMKSYLTTLGGGKNLHGHYFFIKPDKICSWMLSHGDHGNVVMQSNCCKNLFKNYVSEPKRFSLLNCILMYMCDCAVGTLNLHMHMQIYLMTRTVISRYGLISWSTKPKQHPILRQTLNRLTIVF